MKQKHRLIEIAPEDYFDGEPGTPSNARDFYEREGGTADSTADDLRQLVKIACLYAKEQNLELDADETRWFFEDVRDKLAKEVV